MKKLNVWYYGMAVLTVLVWTVCYYLNSKGLLPIIDRMSVTGQVVQYIVILNALICIPLGLYWFKRQCQSIRLIEDEQARIDEYIRKDKVRIVLVSQTMVVAMLGFWLLSQYQSMIWVAAIGAIGWYFTKPTENKMCIELSPTEDQY